MVFLREGLVFGSELPGGVGGEEGGDEVLVFLGVDRTGAVNQTAAGFQAGQGVFEEGQLDPREGLDVRGLQAPADIDPTAEDAGVGTGDIEQDGIEGPVPRGGCRGGPVVAGDLPGADVEAFEVSAQAGSLSLS